MQAAAAKNPARRGPKKGGVSLSAPESPGKIVGWKHLVIPIALVFILAILLFPMPTLLLDICIAVNITISLVVLFSSLYIDRPLMFSSYPAILLVTTLFRLALNIAATRLILGNGKDGLSAAGHIVQAFGEFVVGGNFAIGIVIFIVISIVNLKVITKGSGRIAEVAARFTLDAMPGKQMAIDSDLNTGIIDEAEAKVRRKDLAREAEFYGAMDGAAKFVGGDAVAGMFIVGINIIGGLFIGVVQLEMGWMQAAKIYTLLTIGEGLVAQIPAIIISTSAGLIVARAASGEDLGSDVMNQLSNSDKPLMISSAVCFGFALLPGMPFIPFMLLGAGVAGIAIIKRRAAAKKPIETEKQAAVAKAEADKPKPGSREEVTGLLGMDTLELEVGYELVSQVESGDLVERIRSLRRQFAVDYGFIVPPIHIRDNVRIKGGEYRFLLRSAAIGRGEIKSQHLLAMDPGNVSAPMEGIPTKEPAFGLDALWIPESDKERAQIAGYTVVDPSTIITTHITELVRSHMHELLTRQETQYLLDTVAKDSPKLVEELVPTLLTVAQVQQVLVHLLREGISIRDLKTILEVVGDWAPNVKHPEKLAEQVRRRLARSITAKYLSGDGMLPLVSLAPNLERAIAETVQQSDEGSYLSLEPGFAQLLITKLSKASEKFLEMGQTPLVLVPAHLRPALARFVERFVPGFAVISHQEIAANTRVQSLGVVTVDAGQG
ncbi:MAG: flagellar biosynthesis protein FlhA [Proteobacteria bacterium]|nr:flagellar biosynthesis protein FlhA [Pseudomonadota bacterium]